MYTGARGAQENPPEIPVGAIAHHRAQVPGSHWLCGTHLCVCGTHWSEVVHQGVQHPHCVVRGSLSSHSQAPRSKLELPPVINSASPPLLFLFLPAPPFSKTLLHLPLIVLFVLQKISTLPFLIAFSSFWEEVESYPVFHHQTPKGSHPLRKVQFF